ncbi:MAG: inosine/xanthosine triphosphatase [Methanomassiliicoccales archaeon]|jgi:inosine/xanthosine triphosphatase|nr:inosine/xanthosine triphosphatase [Methanomassiliicoccales archaeon]
MKVAVAGTFNVLHRGHRFLLDTAFSIGDHIVVGITSDTFARRSREGVFPLEKRIARLRQYLSTKNKNWEIEILDDPYGSAITDPDIRVLVASERTIEMGKRISEIRESKGMPALVLHAIPLILAEDCVPISSTRVLRGEINEEGKMLRPLVVKVGSDNPVKIRAVRNVMKRIYRNVIISASKVENHVGEQPWGEDTLKGAIERAKHAIGDADFGVGIEAGIFELGDGLYDVQYCAVIDKTGRITIGHGSGFKLPQCIEDDLRSGKTVGRIFEEMSGTKSIGRKWGAIHFLTKGLITRQKLTEQCVLAAMVPRIRYDLYFER